MKTNTIIVVVIGGIALALAIAGYIYATHVVSEQERADVETPVPRQPVDMWLASGALFILSTVLMVIHYFIRIAVIHACRIASGTAANKLEAVMTPTLIGLWALFLTMFVVAIVLYSLFAQDAASLVREPRVEHEQTVILAISAGALFLGTVLGVLGLYLHQSATLRTCIQQFQHKNDNVYAAFNYLI